MELQNGLSIVTLIMCIITLTMATAALMPQIKQGLVMLRDGLLWAILLSILGTVGFVGWTRLGEARQRHAAAMDVEFTEPVVPVQTFRPVVSDAPDLVTSSSVNSRRSEMRRRGYASAPPSPP